MMITITVMIKRNTMVPNSVVIMIIMKLILPASTPPKKEWGLSNTMTILILTTRMVSTTTENGMDLRNNSQKKY